MLLSETQTCLLETAFGKEKNVLRVFFVEFFSLKMSSSKSVNMGFSFEDLDARNPMVKNDSRFGRTV